VTAGFVARSLEQPCFAALRAFEDVMMRTPIPRHREALGEIGAPLTPTTFATETPRRGVLGN